MPDDQARQGSAGLPEVAERDLVSHYTRLSQLNYGVDTGFYPLGSCSMKYNPKVAETVAALPGFQRVHPLQPDPTVQGLLEMLWRLEEALCEITGMARATLQPPAGACGEMTGLLIMRAFHDDHGGGRSKVLIPDGERVDRALVRVERDGGVAALRRLDPVRLREPTLQVARPFPQFGAP